MGKTLYLLRHGETLFNQLGLKQGACDSPLTENGIEQARQAGRFLKALGVTFEAVYSSTQERACDTTELVYGQDYTRLKGIKEWSFGRHEATPEYLHPDRKENGMWPFVAETGSFNDYYTYFGGESQEEVARRATETLSEVMEIASDDANVLAVSHGALMWAFYLQHRASHEIPPKERPKFGNCSIHCYDYQDGEFTYQTSYSTVEWAEQQKGEEND